MRPVANTQAARTLPEVKVRLTITQQFPLLPSQTSFNPTQVASNKPQTNLPGVSFREGPVASPNASVNKILWLVIVLQEVLFLN